MARALVHLIRPNNKSLHLHRDLKAMELEAAREILAEVFRIELLEVDVMIKSRFEEARSQEACRKEDGLWPQEFWLNG